MPFKKGQSGNPSKLFSKDYQPEYNPGRPPKLPALDVLLATVLGDEKNGVTAAQRILQALEAKAARGDVRAAEVLLERGYGKVKETIALEGQITEIRRTVLSKKV